MPYSLESHLHVQWTLECARSLTLFNLGLVGSDLGALIVNRAHGQL